jgi:hypothetical protein
MHGSTGEKNKSLEGWAKKEKYDSTSVTAPGLVIG